MNIYLKMRHLAITTLFACTLTTQVYAKHKIISHECLDRQEVFNATTTIHHGSAVEPTIAVNPKNRKNIVAAWQQDRIDNGGALEAGIAYTNDGGKHWHTTTVPFQVCSGGISQRVSDVWLSYAADGSRVYLCALAFNATQQGNSYKQNNVVVAISQDGGAHWSEPNFLLQSNAYINEPTLQFAFPDKTSVTADPDNAYRAIAVWDVFNPTSSFHSVTQGSYTTDGGKKWTSPLLIYDPFPDLTKHGLSNGIQNDSSTISNVVVMLPHVKESKQRRLSGDWLNFCVRIYAKPGATDTQYTSDSFPYQFTLNDIVAVRSKDQGKTWKQDATVVVPSFVDNFVFTGGYTYSSGQITGGVGTMMRDDSQIPSYTVNPKNGFLYVAWESSQFRSDQLQQIALTTSRDGGKTWSKSVKVNHTPKHAPNPQAFEPFVAVTKDGRVGILYFDFRKDDKSNPNKTKMDAWLAIYQEVKNPKGGDTEIGLEFVKEIRLSKESYIAQNGPSTTVGDMVDGDYQFLVAHENEFYAVYTKALEGPFTPASVFFTDPANQATILLDSNYRTAPFISIIKNTNKGAKLVSTKKIKFKLD